MQTIHEVQNPSVVYRKYSQGWLKFSEENKPVKGNQLKLEKVRILIAKSEWRQVSDHTCYAARNSMYQKDSKLNALVFLFHHWVCISASQKQMWWYKLSWERPSFETFCPPPQFLLWVLSFNETFIFTGLLKCIFISEAV